MESLRLRRVAQSNEGVLFGGGSPPSFLKGEKRMAKVMNITDKLSFDENPRLEIKGKQYEVNADAKTMLEIMGSFGTGAKDAEAAVYAYERLFSEADRKELNKLSFRDLIVVIGAAMQLVQGEENDGPREGRPVLRPV